VCFVKAVAAVDLLALEQGEGGFQFFHLATDFIDVGVEVPVTVYLVSEPPIIQRFDLSGHDLEELRVPSQGAVQPVGHGEDNVSGRVVARGVEFNDVWHVFDAFPGGETGDTSVWQLFNEEGLDSKSFANGDPNLDSVAIDDISLWRRCQCLLV
jgi:hypothetical protein